MDDKDKKILECAKVLINAINNSGRTVLRSDISDDFGALSIWIQEGKIEVEHGLGTENHYNISGNISNVK